MKPHRIKLWLFAAVLLACPFVNARPQPSDVSEISSSDNSIRVTLDFSAPSIQYEKNGARITLEGYTFSDNPGNPLIPSRTVRLALPPQADLEGVTLSVSAGKEETVKLDDDVQPTPPAMTWDEDGKQVVSWGDDVQIVDGRNILVYNKGEQYPGKRAELGGCSQMRKWKIVQFQVCPVQYNPAMKTLTLVDQLDVTVHYNTLDASKAMSATLLNDTVMDDFASEFLENFDQMQPVYEQGASAALSTTPLMTLTTTTTYDYVIMTRNHIVTGLNGSSYLSYFEDEKERLGFNVLTVTEDCRYDDLGASSTSGGWGGGTGDTAANNLRAWLVNNYSTLGIEYVLLLGNPNPSNGDVPMKGCKANAYDSSDVVPTDYYYADLTGNWNPDGDAYYGEYGEYLTLAARAALLPIEVKVGRIPVFNNTSGQPLYSDPAQILNSTRTFTLKTNPSLRYNALLASWPSDSNTPGYDMMEAIKTNILLPRGWNFYRMYGYGREGIPAPPSYDYIDTVDFYDEFVPAWNSRHPGVVVWWTHGASTGANYIMLSSDCPDLYRSTNHAFAFMCSCWNGRPEVIDNLAFSVLRYGGMGSVAASRVSYYYSGPFDSTHNGINTTITYESCKALTLDGKPISDALFQTLMAESPNSSICWHNMLTFNLYGDPSLSLTQYSSNAVFNQKDASGNELLEFDEAGMLYTKQGLVTGNSSLTATSSVKQWVVSSAQGTALAVMDLEGSNAGKLYIRGTRYALSSSMSTSHVFYVKNASGSLVASIDGSGNLYLKGTHYEF